MDWDDDRKLVYCPPLQGMGLTMLHVGTKQLHGLWAAQGVTTASGSAKAGILDSHALCCILPPPSHGAQQWECPAGELRRGGWCVPCVGHGLRAAAEVPGPGHCRPPSGARAGWGRAAPTAHPRARGRCSPAALLPACRHTQPGRSAPWFTRVTVRPLTVLLLSLHPL